MIEIIKIKKYEFPTISVSDSIVSNIEIDGDKVIFTFDSIGFYIKNNADDCYQRTKESSLILYDCDIDNVDVFLLMEKDISGEKHRVKEYLEFEQFADNINLNLWSYEIIQEYKSDLGSFFIGRIRGEGIRADCYLQIDYNQYGFRYYE